MQRVSIGPEQVQHFQGAVEHQLNSYVILAIRATAYWRPLSPSPGSKIAGEVKLGLGKPTLFKKEVCWIVRDRLILGLGEHSIQQHWMWSFEAQKEAKAREKKNIQKRKARVPS